MREIEKAVLETLQDKSKENPLTRTELRQIVGAKDRTARMLIESLRSQGFRVCSSANRKGYWMAEDEEDYKAFRREYGSKSNTIQKNIKAMDAYTEGQETISGI